jgi:exo-1,4-beta-D-glucosaminidase
MQSACEPVHVQLDLDDSSVAVINRTYLPRAGLHYQVEVTGLDGTSLYKQGGAVSLDTTEVKMVLSLKELLRQTKGISFVALVLKDTKGGTISRNLYWMSPRHDFSGLRGMPAARVQVKVLKTAKTPHNREWTLQFSNGSGKLAFFLNPQLTKGGEEILPSYWSVNYFSLAAGESITVTVSCPEEALKGAGGTGGSVKPSLQLKLEGWNVREQWTGL